MSCDQINISVHTTPYNTDLKNALIRSSFTASRPIVHADYKNPLNQIAMGWI